MCMGIHTCMFYVCMYHTHIKHTYTEKKKKHIHPIAHCVTLGQVFVLESLYLGDPRKCPNLESECEESLNHSDGPHCVQGCCGCGRGSLETENAIACPTARAQNG